MSVNTQEQQLKDDLRSPKDELAVHSKNSLQSIFKSIAAPGLVSENIAIFGSYFTILSLFLLDVITGSEISFHILYVFPLIFIALHSSRINLVTGAVALSILFQIVELLYFQPKDFSTQICLSLMIASSNIVFALIIRYSRDHTLVIKHLSTVDPLTHVSNRRGLEKALERESACR